MSNTYVFKIEGMDCVEEISALKQELSPLVGGDEYLFFDLMNGKLSIKEPRNSIKESEIIAAIAKTGMSASIWGAPRDQRSFYEKHSKSIFTAIGTISIFIAFSAHWYLHGGFQHALLAGNGEREHSFPTVSIIFYSIAILFGGWFVFPKAIYSLKKFRPDMNLLMTIAVCGAIFIGEWLEAASVTILFSVSLLLESWSVERARKATKALLDLAPNNVRIIKNDGKEEVVLAVNVSIGEIFIVKPGERIPLDGEIFKGASEINQAPITGESLPVFKKTGDEVFAGTINGNAALEIVCKKTADHSTLANIIRLVSEAHAHRAQSEQWVEKFARIYTPVVLMIALATLLIPPMLFSGSWNDWLYRSLVLLVIGCPCALVISTPVSIVAALTSAARNGILIKGGKFVEIPAKLTAIAFDKTGTITKGELSISNIITFNHHSERDLLEIASAIESRSEHPIAKAIVHYAKLKGVQVVPAENYVTVQGKGATAEIKNEKFWLGSHRFLEEKGMESSSAHQQLEALTSTGNTVVIIGNSTHICGFITLSDTIKAEAKDTIARLHLAGITNTIMLTGDNRGTAELISSQVGIDHFYSELLPQDKVTKIDELVKTHSYIAMVGDGVNDAPAMARATLGIAMGVAGSDAAIESADIALMTDDLGKLPWLISHSKRTIRIIRQNITFSIAIKTVFIALTFAGHSSLWAAIAADMGASLIVIFNGLRLLR